METNEKMYKGFMISGFLGLFFTLLLIGLTVFCGIMGSVSWIFIVLAVICGILVFFTFPGYTIIEPNNSRVLLFFGKYAGTVTKTGFYWLNPFFVKRRVTLRMRNLNIEPIKVNDKVGNPVMIGAILVWRVKDTYKAMFDISKSVDEFVKIQSDAALRQVAGMYAYDSNGNAADEEKVTLRSDNNGEVAKKLEDELNRRLAMAGVEVVESRINYLAYAQEIASVMLRRQQADAIISARERIVEGAVGMVHLALEKLEKDGVVELDEEKKAAMVSNLLVVLCADESAQPVLNTGTLYQ